jgi:hypothetical protein
MGTVMFSCGKRESCLVYIEKYRSGNGYPWCVIRFFAKLLSEFSDFGGGYAGGIIFNTEKLDEKSREAGSLQRSEES